MYEESITFIQLEVLTSSWMRCLFPAPCHIWCKDNTHQIRKKEKKDGKWNIILGFFLSIIKFWNERKLKECIYIYLNPLFSHNITIIKGKIVTDRQQGKKAPKGQEIYIWIRFLHLGFIVHFLESGDKQLHRHIT